MKKNPKFKPGDIVSAEICGVFKSGVIKSIDISVGLNPRIHPKDFSNYLIYIDDIPYCISEVHLSEGIVKEKMTFNNSN